MLKLYFGSPCAIMTTGLLAALIAYMVWSFVRRGSIAFWGRRTLLLLGLGLLVCIFAATRDNYHLSVQHAIDGSAAPGLFTVASVQSTLACLAAIVIVVGGVLTPILRSQNAREVLFFITSGGILFKILLMEISRILLLFAR